MRKIKQDNDILPSLKNVSNQRPVIGGLANYIQKRDQRQDADFFMQGRKINGQESNIFGAQNGNRNQSTPSKNLNETKFDQQMSSQMISNNLDRDQLYQACLQLKQQVNELGHQNTQLKSQLQFINKELALKLQKTGNSDALQNFKLKQQFREIQQALKSKDAEIELLRRNSRSSKFEEVERSNQFLQEEATRLKQLLEETSHAQNANSSLQSQRGVAVREDQQINQLKKEIDSQKDSQIWKNRPEKAQFNSQKVNKQSISSDLTDETPFLRQKITDLQNSYDLLLRENQQLIEKNQSLETQVKKKNQVQKELSQSSNEIEQTKQDQQKQTQENDSKHSNQIEQLKQLHQKEIESLKAKYQQDLNEQKTRLETQFKKQSKNFQQSDNQDIFKQQQELENELKEKEEWMKQLQEQNKQMKDYVESIYQQIQQQVKEQSLTQENYEDMTETAL